MSVSLNEPNIPRLRYRATDLYIFIMLAFFPLFTGLDGYICLNEKKFIFFAAATVLWLLALLVLKVSCKTGVALRLNAPDYAVLAFMLSCILSMLVSEKGKLFAIDTGRCDGLLTYLLCGAAFLGVSHLGKLRREHLLAFAAAYTVNCIIALIQLCGFNALWLYPNGLNYHDAFVQETAPFLGTLGNIDLFSAYSCLALPIIVSLALKSEGWQRTAFYLAAVLGTACVFAARVASGIAAMTLTMLLFLPSLAAKIYKSGMPVSKTSLVRLAGLVSVCILLGGLLAVYLLPLSSGTLGELHLLLHGRISDALGSHRLLIWRETVAVLRQHPFLGIGPGCLGEYLSVSFSRYSDELRFRLYAVADNAHNEYLQIAVSFGFFGFAASVVLLLQTLWRIIRSKGDGFGRNVLCSAVLCYMMQAFFNIGSCIIIPVFVIILALFWSRGYRETAI